jgi:hypothetical protein
MPLTKKLERLVYQEHIEKANHGARVWLSMSITDQAAEVVKNDSVPGESDPKKQKTEGNEQETQSVTAPTSVASATNLTVQETPLGKWLFFFSLLASSCSQEGAYSVSL